MDSPKASGSSGQPSDVIVVGGGVNGLVCALVLARSGLTVQIIEDKPALGGMHRTEFPFARAPRLAAFTGTHRIGFVPNGLDAHLGISLPLRPRSPSMFVPTTTEGRYILAGAGHEGLRGASGGLLSGRDVQGLAAMHAELDALTDDLAPAWTVGPMSLEEVGDRWVRPALRETFVALCRGSLLSYLARFGLDSQVLQAALAADALGGSFTSADAPGSGAPLLVRHAGIRTTGGGDAVPVGGMGALARAIADAAQAARATLMMGHVVTQILVDGNAATGVVLGDGTVLEAGAVVTSADPWRLRALVGSERFPAEYTRRIDGFGRPGGLAKLVLALSDLPRFRCLPDAHGQHHATSFLLPGGEGAAMSALGRAFSDAGRGQIPALPPLEVVFPSTDEALRDPDGRHSASIMIPWAPYDLVGTTWSAEEERFTAALLDIVETFAPGTRSLVTDAVLYHPKKIEAHFGVTRGQAGHVDDTLLFGDRLPPATPINGLYTCGQGCTPAGGVFGAAGILAARRVISDFELALERTEVGIYG